MSDAAKGTPRVFIYRHGETEWSKNGRYTGITELPLTPHGEEQVAATGKIVVGSGKLIDPSKIGHIFSSPRQRAQQTFGLAFGQQLASQLKEEGKFTTTEKLAEWGYGDYEGLKTAEISELRKSRGLDRERPWDIWRDGCEGEGGESAQGITDRLDSLIDDIHAVQGPNMYSEQPADVVLFAHGHTLRAFVKRWLKFPMDFPFPMQIEAGGVGILSYQEHNVDKPMIQVGMGFPL